MKSSILSINPGHDGAVAFLKDHSLAFCLEAEKDSNLRHQTASMGIMLEALRRMEGVPDVIAASGWENGDFSPLLGTGYHGTEERLVRRTVTQFLGRETELFESTHERSHIFCSYGMSPFPQGQPCYALNWEAQTGAFYEIDEHMRVLEFPSVLQFPGYKYAFLFDVADADRAFGSWNHVAAGKLMALAGYSKRGPVTADERAIIDRILNTVAPPRTDKGQFHGSPYFNCGVTDPAFLELAGKFSDALFDRFFQYAKQNLRKGYPLLIGGGCGLNCEWNTRWKESGLFSDVFVPPVANDSGSAIGTAIEAQYYRDGCAKISWDVYSGAEFVWDAPVKGPKKPLDYDELARSLAAGRIAAWVHGRCEIGPRALGHRSLLAAPFDAAIRDRLNAIKQREPYRPVAPVCLEEDATELFGMPGPSPYMLGFQKVRVEGLHAVTHVDGSARVQTMSREQNPELHALLSAFKKLTGFGVLCNTSLNFPGRGFINRASDLFRFAGERGTEDAVVDGEHYRIR